jgi:hypothetical protein
MALAVADIGELYVKDAKLVANCNVFVQAVAAKVASEYGKDFAHLFEGNADAIRARFDRLPFHSIGTDGNKATTLANGGQFVLGGLSLHDMRLYEEKATMGHIVVVAPGGPSHAIPPSGSFPGARGGYPYCYQGAHIAKFRFAHKTQVDIVFPKRSLAHINYAYIEIK